MSSLNENDRKVVKETLLSSETENGEIAKLNTGDINTRIISPEKSTGNENGAEILQRSYHTPEFESQLERKLRKKSHLVIYATTFIMSIGFSVVLTGIWPYLKELDPLVSKEYLGWVVASNPLGQMIASPLFGWLGSKKGSNRISFLITVAMFIVGNVIYAILPVFSGNAKYLMLMARFIVGVSSANIAVCRTYISASTLLKERTTALSITAAAQSLGYILGPGLQTILAYAFPLREGTLSVAGMNNTREDVLMDETFKGTSLGIFNMYTLPGWVVAFLGLLNLFILLPCVFKEFKIAEKEERSADVALNQSGGAVHLKMDYLALSVILFGYFSILLIYVLLETMIVPMCMDMYAWPPEFAVKMVGLGLMIAGFVTLVMFILGGRLAKVFGDRKVFIMLGLVPITISLFIFCPMAGPTPKIKECPSHPYNSTTLAVSDGALVLGNDFSSYSDNNTLLSRARRSASLTDDLTDCASLGCPASQEWCFYTPIIHIPQLIVACVLVTVGYPVGISLAGAIFSKLLRVKKQGLWMGILTSSGSLSRFLGPVFVSYLYTAKGPLWTLATLFILFLVVLGSNIMCYKRMVPLSTRNRAPPSC